MSLVADGTVVVRDLASGEEWNECVEVWEKHLIAGKTVDDAARQIAQRQAEPSVVETLEVDLS